MRNYHRFLQFIASSFNLQSFSSFALLIAFLLAAAVNQVFAAPGDLDPTFGTGGKVTTAVGNGRDLAQAIASQPDGKIIVAGYAQNDFAVVRYNPNGTLDAAFGTNGRVLTPVGTGTDEAYAVAVQADGKIVVAGRATSSFAVVRYNPNGSLDTTFGTGGKVITPVSGLSIAEAIAAQSDGKIIVAGWSGDFPSRYAILRYNPDGSLDAAFGTNGRTLLTVGSSSSGGMAHALLLQPDGKIVVAGGAGVDVGQSTPSRFSLVRLTATGALDATFGADGRVLTAITQNGSSLIYDLALQPDGKLVASGSSTPDAASGATDTAIARYSPDGTLDATFGTGGIVTTRVGALASNGEAVNLQSDGKIVVAGSSSSGATAGGNDFSALRLSANGTLDMTFGSNGKVVTPIGSGEDQVRDAVIQPDGKLIVAGHSEDANANFNEDFALVRYLGDASLTRRAPFDFDGDSKTDYALFRPASGIWYLLNSTSGFAAAQFGASTDRLVPADYDGDGKTDLAVYRSGTWYLQRSTQGFIGIQFGAADDVPVPGDFTGDGKAEIVVFRPSSGVWYSYNLAANQTSAAQFGANGDKPIPADFDADGKSDLAVFRPSSGTWYVQRSQLGFTGVSFGINTDRPVPADYDGDGKADIAVARQANGVTVWYILGSSQGFYGAQFGTNTDALVPGDYDGDGKSDLAVWRVANGTFYVQRSGGSQFSAAQFGQSGDAPVAGAFVP